MWCEGIRLLPGMRYQTSSDAFQICLFVQGMTMFNGGDCCFLEEPRASRHDCGNVRQKDSWGPHASVGLGGNLLTIAGWFQGHA